MASTAIRTPAAVARVSSTAVTPSGRGFVAGSLDLDGGPAAVVTAVRAGVVGLLGLVAVRTLLERREADREVGAPLTLAGVGDAPLRDSHGVVTPQVLGAGGRRGSLRPFRSSRQATAPVTPARRRQASATEGPRAADRWRPRRGRAGRRSSALRRPHRGPGSPARRAGRSAP